MLPGTDEAFDQRVQAAVERRRRFESGVIDNYSTDSQTGDSVEIDKYSSYSQCDDPIERTAVDLPVNDYPPSDTQTETENTQRLLNAQ